MSGTEILYSKYRIVLHEMSELDEISDSGIEMYSYGEAEITVFKIGASRNWCAAEFRSHLKHMCNA